MNIALLYEAIAEKRLFQLLKTEQLENREILHFKRRLTTFRFLKKIHDDGEIDYTILKGNEKARLGQLRELWGDFLDLEKK